MLRAGAHPALGPLPAPLGHEVAGRVVEVGGGRRRGRARRRASWSPTRRPAGAAPPAAAGRPNLCPRIVYLTGAFAERAARARARSWRATCSPCPTGLAPELARARRSRWRARSTPPARLGAGRRATRCWCSAAACRGSCSPASWRGAGAGCTWPIRTRSGASAPSASAPSAPTRRRATRRTWPRLRAALAGRARRRRGGGGRRAPRDLADRRRAGAPGRRGAPARRLPGRERR